MVIRDGQLLHAVGEWHSAVSDPPLFYKFRTGALSLLHRAYGEKHPITQSFVTAVETAIVGNVQKGMGILESVSDDFERGWFKTARMLISAELFSDFLEMAEHLLKEAYKDAAAVIIGATLEEHLRSLCRGRNIPVEQGTPPKPRKTDTINADLMKASAYTLIDQKQITAWLDLRNNAAHGHYSGYSKDQVQLMLNGVRNFVSRIPE